MPLPSEKAVVLIGTGAVFQPVFLAQREHIEVVDIQDAPQIGVAAENDAEEVVFLPLHPVGAGPEGGGSRYVRIIGGEKHLDAEAQVVGKTVEVVHHAQFFARIAGVVHAAE